MGVTIGYIVSDPLVDYIKGLMPELAPYCTLRILPAREDRDAAELYRAHVDEVDCFATSGRLLYYAILREVGSFAKPCYVMDELKGDIKEALLKLLLRDRNFDFTRLYVDFAAPLNNFLGLRELLPRDQSPRFASFTTADPEHLTDQVRATHLDLHARGEVDFSITRFGNIVKDLKAAGIPFLYIYPSREYAINFFMQIADATRQRTSAPGLFGAIHVSFEDNEPERREALISLCNELLAGLSVRHGLDFMPQREEEKILVLTHFSDIAKITRDFTSFDLKRSLERELGCRLRIGLGSGTTIHQARLNASKAADLLVGRLRGASGGEAATDGVYYFSESEKVIGPIGPLGDPAPGIIATKPDERLIALSRAYHLDHVSLQKIIACAELSKAPALTADDLAAHMGVAKRSAGRLLNKLEEYGGATCYFQKLTEGKGRPEKFYRLSFMERPPANGV